MEILFGNCLEHYMQKGLEDRIEKYKKEINKKQNLALLIEATELLKTYSVKSNNSFDFYNMDKKIGYVMDLTNQIYIKLLEQLLDDLINMNFIIDLNNTSINGYNEDLKKIEELDPTISSEINAQYDKMQCSLSYIRKCCNNDKVNFIELLIEKGQYDVILELLVSSKLTDSQKFNIMDTIIKKYPDKLKKIVAVDIVPSSYQIPTESEETNKLEFNKILDESLRQIFVEKEKYIENVIVDKLKESYNSSIALNVIRDVVEFFVERKLIDINKITWDYNGKEITTAAAAYIMNKKDIAMYLYRLPEYVKGDKLIRDYSDMVIVGHMVKNSALWQVVSFIKEINYINDKEKFFCLMDMMHAKQESDKQQFKSSTIASDDYDFVSEILLRKTKKEEYKKIQRELNNIKNNQELLIQKRQELTTVLFKLNDYLLETEPAKKKIKEITFK